MFDFILFYGLITFDAIIWIDNALTILQGMS